MPVPQIADVVKTVPLSGTGYSPSETVNPLAIPRQAVEPPDTRCSRALGPRKAARYVHPVDEPAETSAPSVREVLANRSVIAYLVAIGSVTTGVLAVVTALGKQVFDLTGRELDLGLLGLAEFLPALLLVIPAGAIADRFDRTRIFALASVGEAAATVGMAWLFWSDRQTLGSILAIVAVFGTFRAIGAPAARSLPVNIVETAALPRVIALNSLAWQVGIIIGPVTGGVLLTVSPAAPHLFAAGSALVSAVATLFIRVRPGVTKSQRVPVTVRSAIEGLRVIRRQPVLLGAISLDLFAVLFGGAVALLPAIAERQLGVGSVGLGWLRAAGGIGASLTALVLTVRPLRQRVGPTLFVAVAIFGVATIGLGLTTSYSVAFAMMLVMSAADSVSVNIRSTLGPLVTPDEVRGRVLAVENLFIGASNELGAFESGVAGQLLGASGAVVFGGAATLVVAGVWALMFPALRQVQRFEDLRPDEPPERLPAGR